MAICIVYLNYANAQLVMNAIPMTAQCGSRANGSYIECVSVIIDPAVTLATAGFGDQEKQTTIKR
jgi:hypothetical protein